MPNFLSRLFLIILTVGLQILVMVFGWGVHPQSWMWIIGGGIFGILTIRVVAEKLERDEKIAELEKVIAQLKKVRGMHP